MVNQKQLSIEKISSIILWLVLTMSGIFAQKQPVWLDADSGNKMGAGEGNPSAPGSEKIKLVHSAFRNE